MLVYVELLLFATIILMYLGLFFYNFPILHITKASLHLTPFRLEGKKGVCRLKSPYRLKNYDIEQELHERNLYVHKESLLNFRCT
jgi:hypothetical protein